MPLLNYTTGKGFPERNRAQDTPAITKLAFRVGRVQRNKPVFLGHFQITASTNSAN